MNAGGSSLGQTPLGRAAREAIEKAVEFVVEKLAAVPWRGRNPTAAATTCLNAGSRFRGSRAQAQRQAAVQIDRRNSS